MPPNSWTGWKIIWLLLMSRSLQLSFGISHQKHLLKFVRNIYLLRSSLFWNVMQHRLVVPYGHFGTTYLSYLQESSSPRGWVKWPLSANCTLWHKWRMQNKYRLNRSAIWIILIFYDNWPSWVIMARVITWQTWRKGTIRRQSLKGMMIHF